jgi:hypothetical protein
MHAHVAGEQHGVSVSIGASVQKWYEGDGAVDDVVRRRFVDAGTTAPNGMTGPARTGSWAVRR